MFCSENIIEDEVPKEMRSQTDDYRQELIESVSNADDKLGEMFLGVWCFFFFFS